MDNFLITNWEIKCPLAPCPSATANKWRFFLQMFCFTSILSWFIFLGWLICWPFRVRYEYVNFIGIMDFSFLYPSSCYFRAFYPRRILLFELFMFSFADLGRIIEFRGVLLIAYYLFFYELLWWCPIMCDCLYLWLFVILRLFSLLFTLWWRVLDLDLSL